MRKHFIFASVSGAILTPSFYINHMQLVDIDKLCYVTLRNRSWATHVSGSWPCPIQRNRSTSTCMRSFSRGARKQLRSCSAGVIPSRRLAVSRSQKRKCCNALAKRPFKCSPSYPTPAILKVSSESWGVFSNDRSCRIMSTGPDIVPPSHGIGAWFIGKVKRQISKRRYCLKELGFVHRLTLV